MQIIRQIPRNEYSSYNFDALYIEDYLGAWNDNYFGFTNYNGGSGASVSNEPSVPGYDGIMRYRCSSDGSRAGMRTNNIEAILFGNKEYYLEWIFKIDIAVTSTNNIKLDFGFGNNYNNANEASEALFFRGDNTGWRSTKIDNNVITNYEPSPSIALNTNWNRLVINLKKDGKKCLFYLNNQLVYNLEQATVLKPVPLMIMMKNQKILTDGTPHNVLLDRFVMGIKK